MSHFFARCASQKRVQFSHVRVFSDSRNVQKRATKSDTSGHCLVYMPKHRQQALIVLKGLARRQGAIRSRVIAPAIAHRAL